MNNLRLADTVQRKPFSCISPALLLAIAGILTATLKNGSKSTYICPLEGYDFGFTVCLEVLVLVLDFVLVLAMGSLANSPVFGTDGPGWQLTCTVWGTTFLVSSFLTFYLLSRY